MMLNLANQNLLLLRLVANADASPPAGLPLDVLTRDLRAGSDAAWLEFHQRYYISLLRYAANRATSPNDAGEIVQEAYLRIARHIKPFTDETQFLRWLACVVRCAAIDHQRGTIRRAILLEKFAHWREAQQNESLSLQLESSAQTVAREALVKLPEDDARLLRLKYCDGWTVDQLAIETQTTPKAVENRLARLRQRLREIILKT